MHSHLLSPFSRKQSRPNAVSDVRAIGIHRLLIQTGFGLFGLFLPIYLYELFDARLWLVFLWAGTYFALTTLVMPLAAQLMNRIGLRETMNLGVLNFLLFFVVLLLDQQLSWQMVALLGLITHVFGHALYWIPYHVEFTRRVPRGSFGSTLGWMVSATMVIGILLPMISGWVITHIGYSMISVGSILLVLASLIPIRSMHLPQEHFDLTFVETWKTLFNKSQRTLLVTHAAEGVETAVGIIVWPIALLLLLGGYERIGVVSTFAALLCAVFQFYCGKITDHADDRRLLQAGTFLSAAAWLAKSVVTTTSQIIATCTFHSFAFVLLRNPFETMMYRRAADAGHYVDEYTVLREAALCGGRALTLLALIPLTHLFGIWISFVIAAVATLYFNRIVSAVAVPTR